MASTLRVFTCIWEPDKLPTIESTMSKKLLTGFRAYEEIFKPGLTHTRKIKERRNRGDGIGAFARPLPTCLKPGCGVRIGPLEKSNVVCDLHDR